MSYKSTLQEHNAKLQEAIDKANALPEAKKIDTCTVEFVGEVTKATNEIFYTKYENGKIDSGYILLSSDEEDGCVLRNVVCGSNVVGKFQNVSYTPDAESGAENMATETSRPLVSFHITAGKGETAVINIIYRDI